jgi:6,7-dimethyl-8-ribityllumazine synthase
MLKSLHIGRYLSNPADLGVLMQFLHAIGFESVATSNARSIVLSAPLGLLSLNSLPENVPADARERLQDVNRILVLEVTDPDSVFAIAQKHNFKVLADSTSPSTGERSFSVELPGEIILTIHGRPADPAPAVEGRLDATGRRFAIVVSRFNAFITERLLSGAIDGLQRAGAANEDIQVVRVPGAFEIPSAARTLAETRKYSAIICIGCLLRGDTAHYDVIVNEVTRGIGQSAQETGVPHAFGVLTCDTLEQAIDRAGLKMGNKGFEAALAAIEMANLKRAVSSQRSAVSEKTKRGQSAPSRARSKTPATSSKRRKPAR